MAQKFRLNLLLLVLTKVGVLLAASIRYDQSQFGDYNVQIQLKNIELYAILDEGLLNSEYDYDYSELTEKPSTTAGQQQPPSTNATTARPHTNVASSHSNSSAMHSNSLSSINSSAIVITNQLLATPQHMNLTIDEEAAIKLRKCAPGYFRDNQGRCRRLRKPHLPFSNRLHSKGCVLYSPAYFCCECASEYLSLDYKCGCLTRLVDNSVLCDK